MPVRGALLPLIDKEVEIGLAGSRSRLRRVQTNDRKKTRKVAKRRKDSGSSRGDMDLIASQIFEAVGHRRELFGQVVSSLTTLFSAIDTNDDGIISLEELRAALRRLDVGLSEMQLNRLGEHLSQGGDVIALRTFL